MEEFYQLLKEYNIRFMNQHSDFPEWLVQYTEEKPPVYWKTIYHILKDVDKNQSIVDIGAGYGDVTAFLYYLGFTNITCFEMDFNKCNHIDNKIKSLFGIHPDIKNVNYPQKLNIIPDILIQVNCVYVETEKTKDEYLEQIKRYYYANDVPKMYLLEVIDDSYKEENEIFPDFVRLNESDIKQLFPNCIISHYATRQFPLNKTSKTLYKICVY